MILLIGYGNRLRRDDGAGAVLPAMVVGGSLPGSVRAVEAHQLLPEMAEEIAAPEVTGVIFFDACPAAGGMSSVAALPLTASSDEGALGHHLAPELLLAYAGKLYGRTPPAWLVTVPGEDFGYGEGFSDRARANLAEAEHVARALVWRLSGG
ncbi:hydrogenase maturation protease [Geobacter sulfurreducens]|jgi:hydrogenase maturation protease|uniref:hydrogenase maturation protease n=1 Tax=Geobacter sulfurreducens TaxID=35554 RepID=UPI0001D8F49A|nr:hydrogenase maturation protease [Geobacter sulfurreducens]ADI85472.1 bidirectional NAD-reducing hydrogenase, maturation protease [Geobacter sulfurreducens KN400]AJY69002.1 hydrogenase [Geobacter sulfurreducens]